MFNPIDSPINNPSDNPIDNPVDSPINNSINNPSDNPNPINAESIDQHSSHSITFEYFQKIHLVIA